MCQSPLIGAQVTFTDCCCLYGEGWGMECALCPATDSGNNKQRKQNQTNMWLRPQQAGEPCIGYNLPSLKTTNINAPQWFSFIL